MTPLIVLLGNLPVDDVVLADGTTRMGQPGGALFTARWAPPCGGRAPDWSASRAMTTCGAPQAVQQRGVDLSGVHHLGRPGVRTWLLYEGSVRRLIHRLGCPTH